MTIETALFPPFPMDARTFWEMNGKSLEYAEKAYRAWLEAAGEMQSEAIDFLNSRLAKDSAMIVRLGRCKTPVEALNLHAEYAGNTFYDLVNEGQKIVAQFGKVAAKGFLVETEGEPSRSGEARSHRRRAHRAGTH
jgi:hypothetical protein